MNPSDLCVARGSRGLVWLTAVLILGAGLLWCWHADSYSHRWNHSEGVYLNSARLLSQGEPLFSSVFSSQPPVFLGALGAWFGLFGDTPAVARIMILLSGMLALSAMAFLSGALFGIRTMPWVVVLAATSYVFSRASHTVEAEMPAVSLGLLSMAICLVAGRRSSVVAAAAGGAVFGLAVMSKLLVAPWVAGAMLLLCPGLGAGARAFAIFADTRTLARVLAFCIGGVAVCGALFLVFDTREMWSQAFKFHFEKRATTGAVSPLGPNAALMLQYTGRDAGIALLGCVGILYLLLVRNFGALWLGLLSFASLAFLAVHTPVFAAHCLIISVCLCFVAAAGAACAVSFLAGKTGEVAAIVLVLLASQIAIEPGVPGLPLPGALVLSTNLVRNHHEFLHVPVPEAEREIIDYLEANTMPGERIVTDGGHRITYWAGRASPPFL